MSEERYKLIKENVYTRCHIAEYTGIGLSCTDKEEIELIDYVEELKDQLQQKEIERLSNIINELEKGIIEFKKQIEEERKNYLEIIGNFVDKVREIKGSE